MTTTTDLTALVREAAFYGVTLRTSADTDDGTSTYTVNGPIDSPTRHDSAEGAATDLTNRITSVQDATEAAHQRAGQWATVQQSAADDNAAWSTLAAEVNAELPHGCNIPTPTANDLYSVSSWPPMTAMVADTLARWHATNRDHAARSALTAEGAELHDNTDQPTLRPSHWDTVVTLWRPVHIVRNPGTNPTVRNGRVVVDQDTRKVIAWRHYGVVTPISRDDMDAAMGEIEHARSVVAEVADRHRAEAERIAGKLRL